MVETAKRVESGHLWGVWIVTEEGRDRSPLFLIISLIGWFVFLNYVYVLLL